MNFKITLLVFFLSSLFSFTFGQITATDSISSLNWMIGKWSISASEKSSDGDSFKETGFQDCSWVLNNRVIRCERYVHWEESSGRYAEGRQSHSSIVYITYNKKVNGFELIRIRPNGSSSQLHKKKATWTLEAEWSFMHSGLGFELFINSSFSKIDNNQIKEVDKLKNADGTFTERYESILQRIE